MPRLLCKVIVHVLLLHGYDNDFKKIKWILEKLTSCVNGRHGDHCLKLYHVVTCYVDAVNVCCHLPVSMGTT